MAGQHRCCCAVQLCAAALAAKREMLQLRSAVSCHTPCLSCCICPARLSGSKAAALGVRGGPVAARQPPESDCCDWMSPFTSTFFARRSGGWTCRSTSSPTQPPARMWTGCTPLRRTPSRQACVPCWESDFAARCSVCLPALLRSFSRPLLWRMMMMTWVLLITLRPNQASRCCPFCSSCSSAARPHAAAPPISATHVRSSGVGRR